MNPASITDDLSLITASRKVSIIILKWDGLENMITDFWLGHCSGDLAQAGLNCPVSGGCNVGSFGCPHSAGEAGSCSLYRRWAISLFLVE